MARACGPGSSSQEAATLQPLVASPDELFAAMNASSPSTGQLAAAYAQVGKMTFADYFTAVAAATTDTPIKVGSLDLANAHAQLLASRPAFLRNTAAFATVGDFWRAIGFVGERRSAATFAAGLEHLAAALSGKPITAGLALATLPGQPPGCDELSKTYQQLFNVDFDHVGSLWTIEPHAARGLLLQIIKNATGGAARFFASQPFVDYMTLCIDSIKPTGGSIFNPEPAPEPEEDFLLPDGSYLFGSKHS